MKKLKRTAPLRAGLSALTIVGLAATGCTLAAGPALADAPDTSSSQSAAADAYDSPIAAVRAAVHEAAAKKAKAKASAASESTAADGSDPAAPGAGVEPPADDQSPSPSPSPTTSPAKPGLTWQRVAGADRFATAVAVAKKVYPHGARTVYIATGTNFPDALAAGPAAASDDAPILLTNRDSIPASTLAELNALHPANVVIVGGTSAVSAKVATTLGKQSGVSRVTRIGGSDRLQTSRLLAEYAFGRSGAPIVFVATGANYPDALSVAAPAGLIGAPILLVNGKSGKVDNATFTEIKRLGATYTVIAGGSAAVSAGIEASIPSSTERFAGADRWATNAMVAREIYSNEGISGEDEAWLTTDFYVATGTNFPDALVGAVPAAWDWAPILLTKKSAWPKSTLSFVKSNRFQHGTLLGGTSALSDSLKKLNTSF